MKPKSRYGFLGVIVLYLVERDHIHVLSSVRAKDTVI